MRITRTTFITVSGLFTLMLTLLPMGCGTVGDSDSDSDTYSNGDSESVPDIDHDTASDSGQDTGVDTVIAVDTDSATHGVDECIYNGNPYTIGMSFPASDGCNTCTCIAGSDGIGQVACTLIGCVDPCANLAEAQCKSAAACRPVTARAVDSDANCLESAKYAGCISADMECGDAITFASKEGVCWRFSDTCVPVPFSIGDFSSDGFADMPIGACGTFFDDLPICPDSDTDTQVDGTCEYNGQTYRDGATFAASDGCNQCFCAVGADGDGVVACTEKACLEPCIWLSESECIADSNCTAVKGTIVDADSRCVGDSVFAGCMLADTACPAVITYARKDDRCWQFGGCVPQNVIWEETGDVSVCGLSSDNLTRCTTGSCDEQKAQCCSSACPCPLSDGTRCVPTHWTDDEVLMGKCAPMDVIDSWFGASARCWQQSDCLEYQFCEGAMVCSCESSCLVADTVGTCVQASMEECNADLAANHCAEGYHCHDMGEMGDICLHDAEGLQCWSNANCGPGQVCEGALLCGSLVDCLSAPGQCVPE